MKLFVTGASGHQVHGLIRSAEKAEACEALGVVPVHGTLSDHDLLADEAGSADAVINAAGSDDRDAVDVLLKALAGSEKALLHTSGGSIAADHANGESSEAIFDEDHLPTPTAEKALWCRFNRAMRGMPNEAAALGGTLLGDGTLSKSG